MRRSRLLVAALAALLVSVFVAAQRSGTPLARLPRIWVDEEPVTFNKEIVRIVQNRCQTCHRTGEIGPFPLVTYRDAYDHRLAIRYQTENRLMPPWHVNSDCAAFLDNPSLSYQELADLRRWVDTGAPEGNPADLPPPRQFSSGWSLGEPDLTFQMPEPLEPDFSKGDVYRCIVFPTNLTSDAFVSAVEIAPGSRAMVHHVILFVDSDPSAPSQQLDNQEPGPGYTCFGGPRFTFLWTLGGWAPGSRPRFLPDGVGMYLPGKSRIVMQVHYSARSGVTEPDRTSIGLYFSRKPVQKRLWAFPVINTRFSIPPGDSNYRVTASIPIIPEDLTLLGVTPHMHLLGKKMKVTATVDGKEVCLVDVPDWDFHWQATYFYKEPIALKAFRSRIDLTAYYDNSSGNPKNPNNPPKEVGWGENTNDEMCIAFVFFTRDIENLTPGVSPTAFDPLRPFWQVDLRPPDR